MATNIESTWRRSWGDAEGFRKESVVWFWGFEVIGALIVGLAGGWVGFTLMPPDPTQSTAYWYPGVGGAVGVFAGLLGAFLVILGWNLFRAPYRQRDELRRLLSTGSNEPSIDSILEKAAPLVELAVDRFLFEEKESSEGFFRGMGRIAGRHRARTEYTKASDALRTLGLRCNDTRRTIIEKFIIGIDEVAYSEDFSRGTGEQWKLATAVYDEFKQQINATA